jgi:hypothetical protein
MHRSIMAIAAVLAPQWPVPRAGEPVPGAGPQPTARDEALRTELIRMAEEDQMSGSCVRASPSDLLLCRDVGTIRHDNRLALDRIIAEYGWPGVTLVGVDRQRAAWLIAQHADDDVAFQKNCLDLVREAFVIGEAEGNALAYLTDRILDHEGSPQMYGTQGVGVFSQEDERRVDANRKAIGLEPWRQYFDKVKKRPRPKGIGIAPSEGTDG